MRINVYVLNSSGHDKKCLGIIQVEDIVLIKLQVYRILLSHVKMKVRGTEIFRNKLYTTRLGNPIPT